ncbi:unnamed protein product [Adineta steineri]|nr:unnamed protein product [Adineta steineri]
MVIRQYRLATPVVDDDDNTHARQLYRIVNDSETNKNTVFLLDKEETKHVSELIPSTPRWWLVIPCLLLITLASAPDLLILNDFIVRRYERQYGLDTSDRTQRSTCHESSTATSGYWYLDEDSSAGANYNKVQQHAAKFNVKNSLATLIPSLFAIVVLGSNCDTIGRRPLLFLPFIGKVVRYSLMLIIVTHDLPDGYLMAAHACEAVFGSFGIVMLSALAYITDCTHESERTRPFLLTEVITLVARVVPVLAVGLWLQHFLYIIPTSVCLGLSVIGMLYVLFIQPESVQNIGYCFPTSNESWSSFKGVFKKKYFSNEEEANRRQIWEENVAVIHKHNLEVDLGLHSYTLAMNQFGDMTNEEFRKQMNGYKMPSEDESSYQIFSAPVNLILPDSVDWRSKGYVTYVKDQGQCGSCWAFSTTGALEGQHFAKTSQLVPLSEQNLVDCSLLNFGCNGGNQDLAYDYIKMHHGISDEQSYPYWAERDICQFSKIHIAATTTGYTRIKKHNETDLQAAIATIGPIAISIDASQSSFQFYSSGVYNEPNCSTKRLDHAVLAVGYGTLNSTDYYIVKNSWGNNWGTRGYILMSRNKQNQCGIATSALYPLV